MAGQNIIEKIAQKHAVDLEEGTSVHSGDYISIAPQHVMTHDNSGAVMNKFKAIGASKIANPRQVVFTLDHDIQNKSEENLAKYSRIGAFAEEMGIDFYPAGRGIGHQVMCEEGYAWPGTMVVASDSHSNMYGGLGVLGTPVVRTDAAAIWATGRTWWQVLPVAKVNLTGKLRPGVGGKDVIIALCGHFKNDEVLNHAIEFAGDGVANLSIDQRLTIANMTTEWGALTGVFPIDAITIDWIYERADIVTRRGPSNVPSDADGGNFNPRFHPEKIQELKENPLMSDDDANYAKELTLDLSTVMPYVAGPDNVKTMTSISEMKKNRLKIHKAYLLSCVNSRFEDIQAAAEVVKGKKVAEGVEFYVAAASNEVQTKAQESGDWKALMDAGAIELPPGCGPCIGLGKGTLGDDEIGISATNRNFKGRMGSRSAKAYLASPQVVAASAIAGYVDAPEDWQEIAVKADIKVLKKETGETPAVKIVDGFPASLEGELVFCYQDNLNTDGIFPGKYTYQDDFTPEQQAEVVMENYDTEFVNIVNKGDLLAGGFNFGSGSSREQAATAFKYKGVAMVIAGSFSQTYKRNAINNGFLVIDCPELSLDLKSKFGDEKLTVKTDLGCKVDFEKSVIIFGGNEYKIAPVGVAAQELIVQGGLENWVKARL